MKTIKEPARDIPVRAEADVLVLGGGPAGIMAAEAAAGDGLRVMLVESRGFLGGNLTIGLPVLGFLGHKGTQIIKGLPQNFIDRLRARGAASEHRPCALHMSLTIIDPEEAKRTALEIMEEKGVEVLLYVFCTDVVKEGDDVKGVIIESKAGREAILAKTVIDCTGDGDVAFRAGVECRKGDAEGGMQPPTLMFCMKGVDVQRLRDAIVGHPDVYDMDVMPPEQFRTGKFITVGLRTQIRPAQAAALEKGTNVMLVESRGFLGGNMTIGLPLLGFLGRKGNVVIKGLPLQFVERLQEKGLATHHRACPLHVSLTMIDPEGTKHLAFQIIKECGIDLLMYAFATDVIMEGNTVKGVIIDSKKGREAILAKRVIDCTGDGDIAYRAGAPMNYGNEKGIPQPPTLMFSMRGVDSRKLRDAVADHPDVYDIDFIPNEFFRADDNCTFVGFRNQIKKAREAGYKLPVERTIFMTGMAPDEWWVNMSRVNGIDATDPAQYTQGEIICAEQNEEIVRYLKAYIPGFENAYVDRVAPFMGIRETRRIVGEYILTEDDIFNCARFDDVIAVASYPVDLHHPVGGDCSLYWCPDCYDIPYRCLIPQKIDGLIVAGRNVSMTHLALASARVMAPAMALGEAAGKAAALSVKENVELRDLDVRKLQESLKAEGVYFRE